MYITILERGQHLLDIMSSQTKSIEILVFKSVFGME